jgi:hypothetical protein
MVRKSDIFLILVGKLLGKRSLGRPRRTWSNTVLRFKLYKPLYCFVIIIYFVCYGPRYEKAETDGGTYC